MSGPPPAPGFRDRPVWLAAVLAAVVGQAGVALDLFGGVGGLTDSRPVISGRHPLHLYHGALGAATFRDRAGTACYDPAYQAGYPKTPVFDAGCRPAELWVWLAGPGVDPAAAYKGGLFAVCVLSPVGFAVAARGVGACGRGSALAAAVGAVVWWAPPVRRLLDAGSVDVLLAGLVGLGFVGGLARYTAAPGVVGWLKLAAAAAAGWYAHPVVWLGLVPVFLGYYFAVAPRHGPAWHLGLVGVTAAGLAPNLWWLTDWGRFWWLRQPSVDELHPLPGWGELVGGPADWLAGVGPTPVGWAVLAVGALGLADLARAGRAAAAGLLVGTVGWAVVVGRLGAEWPTLRVVQADRAMAVVVPALVAPAAVALAGWWRRATAGPAATAGLLALPVVVGWGGPLSRPVRDALGLDTRPLAVGFTPDQVELIELLKARTTPDARILIEDPAGQPPGWNWTALLAAATGRAFLGGLDPGACVEHSFCGLRAGRLNGRPLAEWGPADRADFCRRYNVGWVVCRTPEAAAFWRADADVREAGRVTGGPVLLAVDRLKSFVLSGSAAVEWADRRRVVLTDCRPDPATGELVLSFHHQPGLRAAPGLVAVDPQPDPYDPIPMVKLRLAGPASRVVLTWENP